MFNESQHTISPSDPKLSAREQTALTVLIEFIGHTIQGFSIYYSNSKRPSGEESINTLFVRYFNAQLLAEEDGAYPFSFEKHPVDEEESQNEPDFGVVISNPSKPEEPIFEIEAKRLSDDITSNRQYVYGQNRGAIERFKKRKHGRKIKSCGIVGYVQTHTCPKWLDAINSWIKSEIDSNEVTDLTWENQDLLKMESRNSSNDQFIYAKSLSKRTDNTLIEIHHYLLRLRK
jgi:hypothetical protein